MADLKILHKSVLSFSKLFIKVSYIFITTISVFFLSGCCGKFQLPYTCSSASNSCNHASNSCSNTSHTRGGVPTQIVNVQQVQTKRYVNTRNNCVAYGYDNTCVAW